MKRLLPAVAVILLASCSNNDAKVKSVQKNEDGTTTTTTYDAANVQKMADAGDEMNKKTEALKKLTPLRLDQLKALLPEELNGSKRTDYNASSSMGYAVAEASYQKDENTKLKLMIYDCAGEMGSALYMSSYWSAANFQQESEKEYTKSIDFNGGKAIENFKKEAKETTLTFTANERLLVVLEGRNMEPSEVKDAAQKLKFN